MEFLPGMVISVLAAIVFFIFLYWAARHDEKEYRKILRSKMFKHYANKYPQLIATGIFRCFQCDSNGILHKPHGTKLRKHFCQACGQTLFYSDLSFAPASYHFAHSLIFDLAVNVAPKAPEVGLLELPRPHDKDVIYGINVKAYFCDDSSIRRLDLSERIVPFMRGAKVLYSDTDKKNFFWKSIVAQPDAVLAKHENLISIEYKSRSGRNTSVSTWRQDLRLKDMLQCIVAGYVLQMSENIETHYILRYPGGVFCLEPSSELLQTIVELEPLASVYLGGDGRVASTDFAKFMEPKVQIAFGQQDAQRSQDGVEAHKQFFSVNEVSPGLS